MNALKARGRLSDESGFTLPELLVVLAIMGVVLAGITQLFVSGMRTEVDQTKRFQAQQEARLALDGLRREIHCASALPFYPFGCSNLYEVADPAEGGGPLIRVPNPSSGQLDLFADAVYHPWFARSASTSLFGSYDIAGVFQHPSDPC